MQFKVTICNGSCMCQSGHIKTMGQRDYQSQAELQFRGSHRTYLKMSSQGSL